MDKQVVYVFQGVAKANQILQYATSLKKIYIYIDKKEKC